MKNVRKRFLSALLALALVLALVPVTALANGPVSGCLGNCSHKAAIGTTHYDTLQDAINAAEKKGEDTIVLLDDIKLNAMTVIGDASGSSVNITLDLGSHTLSCDESVLDIYNATVTIQNGTILCNGTNNAAIWCNTRANLIIAENAIVDAGTTGGNFGVAFWQGTESASATINGQLTGSNGLTINGTITDDTNAVRISSTAVINVTGHGLYLAGNGTTTVADGAVIRGGAGGIEAKAGKITIGNNAQISVTGTGGLIHAPDNDGTSTSGYAIAVVANDGYAGNVSLTINGSSVTGSVSYLDDNSTNSTSTEPLPNDNENSININSGTFTSAVGNYVGTSTYASVGNAAGTTYYVGESHVQAVAASAPSGSTVTVLNGSPVLNNVPVGVTVLNSSSNAGNTVLVNGSLVTAGGSMTVQRYYAPPIILSQPQAATATEGGVASFSVSAMNPNNPWNPNDLSIRWMISYDGGTVWKEFAVGPTAELPVTMAENGMQVQCRVNNGVEVRLEPVTVTVLPGMDIVPGEEEIIDPGEEEGDVQEGTENTPSEEGDLPEEGLEELPEEGEDLPEEPVDVPKTGDSMPSVGLALLFGLAACAVVLKKARAK